MQLDIYQTIIEINNIFDTKYRNRGFLYGTNHTASSFFMTGACWYYAYILKQLFPEGKILISERLGHVVLKFRGKYYDVLGEDYFFNEEGSFVDEELRCSSSYIHSEEKEVLKLIDLLASEIKNKSVIPSVIEEVKHSNKM